ncbi:SMI1/KNR4 family protein [Streptomyces venezuelae]|uniref:SMI1/KNR4 family protein n=1 Tax=Streptomyces venezuelae TaxID=54571 RepID=UPI001239F629|nr:SMI1/KNR4 family protein [Streptomyces venezuelae]
MGGVWAGVRERVLALRDAPNRRAVFGAYFKQSGHEFELRPVLTEEQVAAVERQGGVRFPEEYRTFLLEVGAGGAGPDYGLFTIDPPEPGAPPGTDPRPGTAAESTPAEFRPERTAEWEEHQAAEPYRSAYGDSDEEAARFRADYTAWDKRDDELLDSLTEGALYVSEQGCAYYTLLAMTGPERGTMWQDVRAVGEGVVPYEFLGSTARVTFAEWYHHWLTRAERVAWQTPEEQEGSPA